MKNPFVLFLICLLSGFTGFAQTQQGERYFGGNLRFGTDKTKFDNSNQTQTNNLNARVETGKFLYDDFAIGGALQIEREASPKGTKSRNFNPQLLGTARYYAGKENAKAKIFVAGQLGLSISHSSYLKITGPGPEERERITQIGGAYGIGAGAAWFLSKGIAVEGLMGWEGHSLPKSKSNVSFTGLKIGLTAYLGQPRKPPVTRDPGKYDNYGGKIGIGISILDGFGVPVRYYLSPKKVVEAGIYLGGIAVRDDDKIQAHYGLMFGGGFTFFGDRFEKEKKKKIRAHGLALRLNYLTGDYSTTMLSAGWAMETFRKDRTNRSFIFELGLRGQFANYEINGDTDSFSPTGYLKCTWNIFVK